MGADIIQAQYDQLEALARRFGQQADVQTALQKRVRTCVERLRNAGWEGRGSTVFYAEMDGKVFPTQQRLIAALQEAQKVTLQMRQVLQAAEEEAARPFHGSRTGDSDSQAPSTSVSPDNGRGSTGLPPMPDPPPQLPGDGSGPHGGAGAPTEADWETHRKMTWAALLARLRGYDIVADHMAYFLGNSGEPLAVDVDRMMTDMPEFRRAAEQQFRQEIWTTAQQYIAAHYTGEPLQFPITTEWRSDYYPSRDQYPNWFYGVGGFSSSQTALVTVTPGPDGAAPVVSIRSQVYVFDRYNWDPGKGVTIPSSGNPWIDDHTIAGDAISDTEMGRLHATGIAQEYEMYGHADPVVTTYPYDPATDPQQAPQMGTGNSGGR